MSSSSTPSSHTQHTNLTPLDAYAVITDPDILPSLTAETSLPRRLRSYFVLGTLVAGGLFLAYILGVDILQTRAEIVGIGLAVVIALGFAGGWNIDWWELVLGYWWLSMPVAGLAGVAFLVLQEGTSGMVEVE